MKDKASFKKIHTQKHVPTHAYILEHVYELPINDQLPLAHESIETKRTHSIKKKTKHKHAVYSVVVSRGGRLVRCQHEAPAQPLCFGTL